MIDDEFLEEVDLGKEIVADDYAIVIICKVISMNSTKCINYFEIPNPVRTASKGKELKLIQKSSDESLSFCYEEPLISGRSYKDRLRFAIIDLDSDPI